MSDTRITMNDSGQEILIKMCDGNPGALTAMMEIMQKGASIDSDAASPVSSILLLDSCGIYGTDIYVLWSDICNRNTVHMMAILRATQLGLFDRSTLKDACSRQDYSGKEMVPITELCEKVLIRLPSFNGGVIETEENSK